MAALILFLWLAFQNVSPEAVQHVHAGLQAKQEGHLDKAITEFKKVTELEPSLAAAFVNLGEVYLEAHDQAAAIAPLKRSLELNPELVGAHQMLGFALLAQGYSAEAIPHLERAQAQDGLGIALLEAGRYPEAIFNLEQALSKRPNDPDLLYYLGRASGLLSKQSFDALSAAYPDSAREHQATGENYAVMRRIPEAEKEYLAALKLRPDTPGVHLQLGELYEIASQLAKAEEEFRAETSLRPGDAESAYRLGAVLLKNGKVHNAHLELTRADRLKPGMPETLYSLGKAASLDNDPVDAEKSWQKLLSVESESALAAQTHFALASLYRKQGKTAEADHELSEFRRLQAKSK